jgi:hypothetical protein
MYEWLLAIINNYKESEHILELIVLAVALVVGLATGQVPEMPTATPVATIETVLPSTATNTLQPVFTLTLPMIFTSTFTNTPVPDDPIPTNIVTIPTATLLPTATFTVVPSSTFTLVPTFTRTPTRTPTNTLPPANTSTNTPIVPTSTQGTSTGTIWYVAVDGKSSGDGTLAKPWDSRTGQWDNSRVKAGDTVCFLSGIYDGVAGVRLNNGMADKPITIRPCDGHKAVIRRGTSIYSNYIIFMGFEIYYPYTNRTSQQETSHPTDLQYRSTAVTVLGNYVKVINNTIHDMTQGISVNVAYVGAEVYGNIIYNVGWTAPDRDHGHGIYPQNVSTSVPMIIENNVVFNNFSDYNIHIYAESPIVVNTLLKDNITWNGTTLVGGSTSFDNITVLNNFHYGTGYMRLGYSSNPTNKKILVEGNTYKDIRLLKWSNAILKNNRYDSLSYTTTPTSITGSQPYPTSNEIIWQQNKYDGSYLVVIHNPEGLSQITLDVPFSNYTITNVQNMAEKQTNNVINMNGFTYLKPLGHDSYLGPQTTPYFLVLLVKED